MTDKPDITTEQMLEHLRRLAEKALCFETSDSNHHREQERIDLDIAAIRSRLSEYDALKLELGLTAEQLLIVRAEADDLRAASEANHLANVEAIKERDALKAEVEKLKRKLTYNENALKNTTERAFQQKARSEKAEAELAAARPLLEAVMGNIDVVGDGAVQIMTHAQADRILEAALAYRQAKGEK